MYSPVECPLETYTFNSSKIKQNVSHKKTFLLDFSLYEYGQDLNIQTLYPTVSFPVSKNTPMISPAIK